MFYILTFQILSWFSAKFHVLSRAISRPGQIIFKSSDFQVPLGTLCNRPVWKFPAPPPYPKLPQGVVRHTLPLHHTPNCHKGLFGTPHPSTIPQTVIRGRSAHSTPPPYPKLSQGVILHTPPLHHTPNCRKGSFCTLHIPLADIM